MDAHQDQPLALHGVAGILLDRTNRQRQVIAVALGLVVGVGLRVIGRKGHALDQLIGQPHQPVDDLGGVADHRDQRAERGVLNPRAHAALEALHQPRGRDHGRQLRVVAVRQNLVQLLLGPGAGGLRAEVVEHQHLGVANRRKQGVVGDLALRAEGRAQMVQEVGDKDPQRRRVALQQRIDDGGRQVRLATARGAGQDEPAGRGRGERLGQPQRLGQRGPTIGARATLGVKGGKALRRERTEL